MALGLVSLMIVLVMPDIATSAVVITATVSSTMTGCTTPMDGVTNNFGPITNLSVFTATTTSTTVQSSGAIYMKVYDVGSNTIGYGGLWKSPDIIPSPSSTYSATATLVAGSVGFGIQAEVLPAAGMGLNAWYNYATSGTIVGRLNPLVASSTVVASSAAAVADKEVRVYYKVAVNINTPGGAYQDTVTFTCSTS